MKSPIHHQKVIAHAEERLTPEHRKTRTRQELIALYKRFLKIEEHRIRMEHKAHAGGLDIARRRSGLLDLVLQNLFTDALTTADDKPEEQNRFARNRPPIALVATGGYGRGTLNPGSDIDLLFLHAENGRSISNTTSDIIEQVLYMLWDVGFKVGHAVRSIKETIKQANGDNQTKTALLEARLLTGDEALFKDFEQRFHKECVIGKEKEYLATRAEDIKARHKKYARTVYLQEPNVKESCGGLRDFQNLIWTTHVIKGSNDIEALVEEKLLTRNAWRELNKAYEFLMRVRNDLHYAERRATDILTLRLQGVVATNLGYPQKSMLRRTEEFMRDYYLHTRNIYQHVTSLFQTFQLAELDESERGLISFLALRSRKRKIEHFDSFYSRGGLIYPDKSSVFKDEPRSMLQFFQHAQRRHLRLSPQARKAFKRAWPCIDRPFRYNKANRETFEAILSRKGDVARVLRQMHRVGFLGRYLPEFGALDCLVQHEFFHRYTADEHTLRCIDELDELVHTTDPALGRYQKLFHEVEDPYALYLALILHDTGRAKNHRYHSDASATLASRVCNRLQIKGERRRHIIFLVDHHLTLWRTATTKNLDDPNTIAEFARAVPNQTYLDLLFLFTYSDSRGTGEQSWTDWKESLMIELYLSTSAYFEDQEAFQTRIAGGVTELKSEVAAKLPASFSDEVEAHFAHMPKRYFRFRTAPDVVGHIRSFRKFFEILQKKPEASLTPFLKWKALEDRGYSEVQLYGWNRPLLLAKISGAFAARNLNILSADIFTREDDLAMDIFRVCTVNLEPVTSERDIKTVEKILQGAFQGDPEEYRRVIMTAQREMRKSHTTDFEFPQRVHISNHTSPEYTVLEIQAIDRIGLLYDILTAIGSVNLETASARINTEKGAAIDTFYLTDIFGAKITDPNTLGHLHTEIEKVIGIAS